MTNVKKLINPETAKKIKFLKLKDSDARTTDDHLKNITDGVYNTLRNKVNELVENHICHF